MKPEKKQIKWREMFVSLLIIGLVAVPLQASAAPAEFMLQGDTGDWIRLGNRVDDKVFALAFDSQENLYVGAGYWPGVGDPVFYILKWDGISWTTIASSINGIVSSLAFDNQGNLYAGGGFTFIDGVTAARIAKWNGNKWTALGDGLDNSVVALIVDKNDNLFAGGSFNNSGALELNGVGMWDGNVWSAMSGPSGTGVSGNVSDFAFDNLDDLYIGGSSIFTAGGVVAKGVAKWDGNEWSGLGAGLDSNIQGIAIDNQNNIYAGGSKSSVPIMSVWNGANWSDLDSTGLDEIITTVEVDGLDNVYVGGDFTTIGGQFVNRIAKWNGSNWTALGLGMDKLVYDLAIDSRNDVYAGGLFTNLDGLTVNGIGKLVLNRIFGDGFESGDISMWSGTNVFQVKTTQSGEIDAKGFSCSLCVNSQYPIGGDYDLELNILNKAPSYLYDQSPISEARYRARFYIETLGLNIPINHKLKIFRGYMGTKKPFSVIIRGNGKNLQVRAIARLNAGKLRRTKWHRLSRLPNAVEIDWKAATAKDANNGHLRLWVNGKLQQKIGTLNNHKLMVDEVRFGVVQRIKKAYNISGVFFLDAFISDEKYYAGK